MSLKAPESRKGIQIIIYPPCINAAVESVALHFLDSRKPKNKHTFLYNLTLSTCFIVQYT